MRSFGFFWLVSLFRAFFGLCFGWFREVRLFRVVASFLNMRIFPLLAVFRQNAFCFGKFPYRHMRLAFPPQRFPFLFRVVAVPHPGVFRRYGYSFRDFAETKRNKLATSLFCVGYPTKSGYAVVCETFTPIAISALQSRFEYTSKLPLF